MRAAVNIVPLHSKQNLQWSWCGIGDEIGREIKCGIWDEIDCKTRGGISYGTRAMSTFVCKSYKKATMVVADLSL